MKKMLQVLVISLALGLGMGTATASITCTGNIERLALSINGLVQVDYGHGVHYVCRLTSVYNTVEPEACRALYSMLLAAELSNREVFFNYNTYAACADLPDWAAPSPASHHFGVKD